MSQIKSLLSLIIMNEMQLRNISHNNRMDPVYPPPPIVH